MLVEKLTNEQLQSIKKSYLNIVGLFLENEKIESRFLRCLLKWGFQLNLNPADLQSAQADISNLGFIQPEDKISRLESIYHLVFMIYLDNVVEDIELEVATIYAEKLGFKSYVVSELFQSIVTAKYDEDKPHTVREEILEFLKMYEA
jgi:hypothetical protein